MDINNMATTFQSHLDFRKTISSNRLLGLWRMMKGYRLHYLAATVSLGIAATSKTLTYLLLGYYVDVVLGGGQFGSALLMTGLGFLGLSLMEGGFTFLGGRLAAYTAENITRSLRNYVFDHLQRLTFSYHAHTPTGELVQRSTSDMDAVRRFFSDQAINSGRILLLFIINFTALVKLNLTLALVSVALVPFVVGVSMWFFKKISDAYEAYQQEDAILSTTLQENLSGIRVVKAFSRQDYERKKFEKTNAEKFKRGRHLLVMNAIFWPSTDLLCVAQLLLGLFIGAGMAISGEITIGTFMAYTGVVGWIIWPMRNLGRLIVDISSGIVSYARVMDIVREEREPLDEGDTAPVEGVRGEIVFDDVCFEYEKDHPVLKNVSFSCQPGQVVALLGSTGSGKSSLVNLLPRFYDITSGSILLDGIDIRRYPRRYLRQQIGIVDQEPFLFSRTIRENIAYGVGKNVGQEEVEKAAMAAVIHDSIMTFPEGYHTLVGERGVTLSGGQKQRTAVARTLLRQPHILILDDSTSAVDMETEAEMRQALADLMKNRTTFIIAHRLQSVMNADLILVFDQGKIVQRGTHESLLAEEGFYKQIFEIQTRIETELQKEMDCV
jgi:ATP-binding cassette, subfamily B, bacterial